MSERTNRVQSYVSGRLTRELDTKYRYHNLEHTQRVVKSTEEILESSDLEAIEREQLVVAAWFHDLGYLQGPMGHEETGARMARNFLLELGAPEDFISEVDRLILATRRHHQPKDFKEEVIRDADSAHFALDQYRQISEFLKEELDHERDQEISPENWCELNIRMLEEEHRYYTDYAIEHWQPYKNKNLKALKKERKARKQIAQKEELKARYKNESPDRSIQTLYRVTLRNHLKLSDIADTKANILLSVNAIIISLMLANLFPKLDNPSNAYLILPTLVFVIFSVISMVLSILATRPQIGSGTFTQKDIEENKVNLLFFGNFHRMSLPDFQQALQTISRDKEFIYDSLSKDLYYLGKVLDKKYRLLRLTYTIFMLGMIASVVVFACSFLFYGPVL